MQNTEPLNYKEINQLMGRNKWKLFSDPIKVIQKNNPTINNVFLRHVIWSINKKEFIANKGIKYYSMFCLIQVITSFSIWRAFNIDIILFSPLMIPGWILNFLLFMSIQSNFYKKNIKSYPILSTSKTENGLEKLDYINSLSVFELEEKLISEGITKEELKELRKIQDGTNSLHKNTIFSFSLTDSSVSFIERIFDTVHNKEPITKSDNKNNIPKLLRSAGIEISKRFDTNFNVKNISHVGLV